MVITHTNSLAESVFSFLSKENPFSQNDNHLHTLFKTIFILEYPFSHLHMNRVYCSGLSITFAVVNVVINVSGGHSYLLQGFE